MKERLKAFCLEHRELIAFILVGGLTTAAAWGGKYLCDLIFFGGTAYPTPLQNSILSVVENLAAIACAYPTNRKWVFHSTDPHIAAELLKFAGSRTAVWILGWLLNMLFVSAFGVNVYLSTVLTGFIGAAVNYVLSKLLIFGRKDRKESGERGTETADVIVPVSENTELRPAA